ncbi:hypothetical protein NF699_14195 [Sphingomonadaceae bacterium OTU29LAMAA1]|nr:hypothetical protein NF699_14195 [Sphingomonadaceae bacterium OTU29LAMAA1]
MAREFGQLQQPIRRFAGKSSSLNFIAPSFSAQHLRRNTVRRARLHYAVSGISPAGLSPPPPRPPRPRLRQLFAGRPDLNANILDLDQLGVQRRPLTSDSRTDQFRLYPCIRQPLPSTRNLFVDIHSHLGIAALILSGRFAPGNILDQSIQPICPDLEQRARSTMWAGARPSSCKQPRTGG